MTKAENHASSGDGSHEGIEPKNSYIRENAFFFFIFNQSATQYPHGPTDGPRNTPSLHYVLKSSCIKQKKEERRRGHVVAAKAGLVFRKTVLRYPYLLNLA